MQKNFEFFFEYVVTPSCIISILNFFCPRNHKKTHLYIWLNSINCVLLYWRHLPAQLLSNELDCCLLDLEKVDEIVKKLLEEKNSLGKKDVPAHLDFLKKAEKSLHPNHYIIKITQRWILPMTNCQIWPDKKDALKSYLNLLNQMNLGLCKDKARLLYEKAHMEMLAFLNDFNQGLLKKSDFIKVIESELLPLFDEVKWILRYDARTSVEGKIFAAVESYMSTLRDFVVQ